MEAMEAVEHVVCVDMEVGERTSYVVACNPKNADNRDRKQWVNFGNCEICLLTSGNSMATISTAKATLRIIGDSLRPEEVSSALGAIPTTAQFKGEELVGSRGISRIAKFGMWRLTVAETTPADLDAQVREILAQLSGDITVWQQLAEKYDMDVYCGWFMEQENEGLGISATTLRELGVRGIELSLDIYAGDREKSMAPEQDRLPESGQ